jgi:capsular exopolysaccharide synthesis family protein
MEREEKFRTSPSSTQDETIDVVSVFKKIIRYRVWYGISMISALIIAFILTPRNDRVFKSTGKILIASGEKVPDQIEILKSRNLVAKTIEDLNFEVSYYSLEQKDQVEIYRDVPFMVIQKEDHPQPLGIDFYIEFLDSGKFSLEAHPGTVQIYQYNLQKLLNGPVNIDMKRIAYPGEEITGEGYSFNILLTEHYPYWKRKNIKYKFVFHSYQELIEKYKASLVATRENRESSVIALSVTDGHRLKAQDFLNKHIETYLLNTLDQREVVRNSTVNFLDEQIQVVSDSMIISGTSVQSYLSGQQAPLLSGAVRKLLNEATGFDIRMMKLNLQLKYYSYLSGRLVGSKVQYFIVPPSVLGDETPVLNNLIFQLNKIVKERSSVMDFLDNPAYPVFDMNPTLEIYNRQVETIRNSAVLCLNDLINNRKNSLDSLRLKINSLNQEIRRIPAKERNYLAAEKDYNRFNEIYNFLVLQKSKAKYAFINNVSDSQIIDKALDNGLVKQDYKRNFLIALVLGLLIPSLLLFFLDLFNNRVTSDDDVRSVAGLPVTGHVFYQGKEIVVPDALSVAAVQIQEAFHAVRNRLTGETKSVEKPVIAVTSAAFSEGKSFVSLQVAASFARAGYKTALLDLHLRKPGLNGLGPGNTMPGVMDYISEEKSLDEIIIQTTQSGLDLVPAGTNGQLAGEFPANRLLCNLLDELKNKYDIIIMDMAPAGYLADSSNIFDKIDATIVVVRHGITKKDWLKAAMDEINLAGLKRVCIVMNAIRDKEGSYSWYRLGYS